MAESEAAFLQRLRDEDAIRAVLHDYCRGIDRRDYDLVRSVYHPDAVDEHGAYNGGVDGLIEWARHRHETVAQSMHMLGNVMIEVRGDVADVETYCVVYQRLRDTPAASTGDLGLTVGKSGQQTQVRCRYLDRLEYRDAEWRIAHRTVAYESLLLEDSVSDSGFGPEMVLATRDEQDPLYTRLGA